MVLLRHLPRLSRPLPLHFPSDHHTPPPSTPTRHHHRSHGTRRRTRPGRHRQVHFPTHVPPDRRRSTSTETVEPHSDVRRVQPRRPTAIQVWGHGRQHVQ